MEKEKKKRKHKLRMPNSYIIIMGIVVIVAILSYVVPGGGIRLCRN